MTSQRNVSYRPTSNMIFEGTEWIWKYWMGWTWLSWNTSVWFRVFWETLAKTCRRRAVKCLKPLNSTRARKTYAASALEKDRAVAGTGSLGSLVEIHSFYRLPVLKCYSLAVQKKTRDANPPGQWGYFQARVLDHSFQSCCCPSFLASGWQKGRGGGK